MSNLNVNAIIGIDPGASGGLSLYRPNATTQVTVVKMPENIQELREWFEYVQTICAPIVFLEKQQLRISDMYGGKAFNMQKLFDNFNTLKVMLEMLGIPYVLVNPMKWQSELKLRKKDEEKAERKNRYKEIAGKIYPKIKATLWNADALLIMHFGRYALKSNLDWVKSNIPQNMYSKLIAV